MDRWILPTRQSDLPGRELVAHELLHARRESTFLALVSFYLVAMVALFAGSVFIVDLGVLLNLDTAQPLQLSLGVVLLPIAIGAAQLVCELYSSRRAGALVIAGTFVSLAIVGVQTIATGADDIVRVVALVACGTIAQAANVLVFSAARIGTRGRNLGLRIVLSAGLSQLLGWSAFIIVLGCADILTDTSVATAMAACVYVAAASLALALPLMLARRWLAMYLRVGRYEDDLVAHHGEHTTYARKLPPAVIVEDEPEILGDPTIVDQPLVERRAFRPQLHPFTTGEMEFFAEGDAFDEEHYS